MEDGRGVYAFLAIPGRRMGRVEEGHEIVGREDGGDGGRVDGRSTWTALYMKDCIPVRARMRIASDGESGMTSSSVTVGCFIGGGDSWTCGGSSSTPDVVFTGRMSSSFSSAESWMTMASSTGRILSSFSSAESWIVGLISQHPFSTIATSFTALAALLPS